MILTLELIDSIYNDNKPDNCDIISGIYLSNKPWYNSPCKVETISGNKKRLFIDNFDTIGNDITIRMEGLSKNATTFST